MPSLIRKKVEATVSRRAKSVQTMEGRLAIERMRLKRAELVSRDREEARSLERSKLSQQRQLAEMRLEECDRKERQLQEKRELLDMERKIVEMQVEAKKRAEERLAANPKVDENGHAAEDETGDDRELAQELADLLSSLKNASG